MRTAFVISLGCLCLLANAAEPPGSQHKEPYWSRATFAMHSGGQPNLQIIDVTRNGDELFANLSLSNSTHEKRVPPPITVHGVQLSDGSFWPDVRLHVGDDSKGPWETIPAPRSDGEKTSVTIPSTLSLLPLRVDFLPFVPFFGRKAWGRVLLPNGEATVFEIKELQD
jgi:hypothetical protein